jgi:acyl phosphate:glycerol-3-phosphate acyltransferase
VVPPSLSGPLWLLLAFLCGSVPFGVLVARARGVDLRTVGSKNIGAANVTRNLGKKLGALVLVLDAGKGALPVGLASVWSDGWIPYAAAFAAIAGHCFTPWLRFRGGKGVATTLGVFLVIDPAAIGIAVAVFALVFAVSRIVAVGSLAAAAVLPIAIVALGRSRAEIILAVASLALVLALHRDNLARLRTGRENRL